jgi:hypothetical protein
MKMVAEYLFEAVKFERMASDTDNSELKAAFRKQASEYRKLAVKRAKELAYLRPIFLPMPRSARLGFGS